jgi:hypothetical protein
MTARELLPTLERIFAGPRDSLLTMNELLAGLAVRSYAFAIAIFDLPNCIPTGIPLLSTVTGVPMLLFVLQRIMGHPNATLPHIVGDRGLARGRLQDVLERARRPITWLESIIHPRNEWWIRGRCRVALGAACVVMIVILALPIPFDNLFAAWAIMFFCLALIEGDGVMAMLGWLLTVITLVWTALLLIVGPWIVIGVLKSIILV